MTKVDIFSGFLGAGKTTLIKKLIREAYSGEKLVLIENEFGTIGIDGEFLKESGIQINELNSGCICCSLVGDFSKALKQVISEYSPDRIIIEPSGVGKLSDVIKAVENAEADELIINGITTVADASKCKLYMKNFGEFFNDQIENATSIVLSHTDTTSDEKLQTAIELIKEHNHNADLVTTPWDKLTGSDILAVIEKSNTLKRDIEELEHHHGHCGCGHHHHEHDEHCGCGHEHHHHHDEHCECGHEHHHHDEHCECGHEHHHHDEHCGCGHHHEHEHHHADEVFASWGCETAKKYTVDEITDILKTLENKEYGMILRAKGIVASTSDEWIHFDYVPGEPDVRYGTPAVCGRICVIGSEMNEDKIKEIF